MDALRAPLLDSNLASLPKTLKKILKNGNGNVNGAAHGKENLEPNGNFVPPKQANTTTDQAKPPPPKKKGLQVRFAPLPEGTSGMSKAVKKISDSPDHTKNALSALISIWGKHYARSSVSNYIPRIAFACQPGLTADYMKYVCTLPCTLYEDMFDGILAPQTRLNFISFLKEFSTYQNNVFVATDNTDDQELNNIASQPRAIVIFQTKQSPSNSSRLKALLGLLKNQCLIVMADPLYAFQIPAIEKALSIKVRQVVFPLLGNADLLRSTNYVVKDLHDSFGVPLLNENESSKEYEMKILLREFALWRRPELADIAPLYMHLFMFVKFSQIYPNMAITLNTPYSILDVAATLGFAVVPAKSTRDSSSKESSEDESNYSPVPSSTEEADSSGDSKESSEDVASVDEDDNAKLKSLALTNLTSPLKGVQVPVRKSEPYVIKALPPLSVAFQQDFPQFNTFEVIQAHQQLWQEAERAIIRVMADDGSVRQTMGQKWPFLAKSFVAEHQSVISKVPLVIPKVTKRSSNELSVGDVTDWLQSENTMFPVKKTMTKSSWKTLLERVRANRSLYPMEKSKSPDYLVKFKKSDGTKNILCFQVKSGIQDLSVEDLKEEIAKCPFVEMKDNLFIWGGDDKTTITFVYVAANHLQIKNWLKQSSGVEKCDDVSYRITHENPHLALPQSVEVIVLRQPGLQSLFGNEAYNRLLKDESLVSFAEAEKNIWFNLLERFRAKPKPTAYDKELEIRTKLREVLALAGKEHEYIVLEEVANKFSIL